MTSPAQLKHMTENVWDKTKNDSTLPDSTSKPEINLSQEKTYEQGFERYVAYARSALIPFGRSMLVSGKQMSRYLAYSSDVGESVRLIVNPNVVRGFYALSWGYVSYDVYYYGQNSYQQGKRDLDLYRDVGRRALFQSVASMALPAFTIHQAVHWSAKGFANAQKRNMIQNARLLRWGPTCVGMCIVPFLPYMFDEPVENILHKII